MTFAERKAQQDVRPIRGPRVRLATIAIPDELSAVYGFADSIPAATPARRSALRSAATRPIHEGQHTAMDNPNEEVAELVEQARALIAHGRELDAQRRAEVRAIHDQARELVDRAQRIREADSDEAGLAGRWLADEAEAWLASDPPAA